MAESFVQVTEGAGKKLHTYNKTIGANSIEDDVSIPGEPYLAAYTVIGVGISVGTANDHIMQLMAGSSLNLRIRRVRVIQSVNAGALTVGRLQIVRLTTAGSGGTAVTPGKYENGDSAAGATAQTLPTAKGTEGTIVWTQPKVWRAAADPSELPWEWLQLDHTKPIVVPSGTANGVAIKSTIAAASGTCDVIIEFVESNF